MKTNEERESLVKSKDKTNKKKQESSDKKERVEKGMRKLF
jgi:hypothetical protein